MGKTILLPLSAFKLQHIYMTQSTAFLVTTDFLVSKERFFLMEDSHLDMLITFPQPEQLQKYYKTETYISHQNNRKTLIQKIYHYIKLYTIKKKIQLIENHTNGEKTLLDIGTGTGDFLKAAQNKDWVCYGVEPNIDASQKASAKNLTIVNSLNKLTEKKFQVITLWHVLEHLPNLEEQISIINTLLNTHGTLILAVPNFKSFDAKYYGKYWAAYDTPRHLWHFSQKSISKLFNAHGLYVKQTLPMYFDSIYVSLLSEKYKTGKNNYTKALYQGLRSNIKARKTGEYSSLIYVLQKHKNPL